MRWEARRSRFLLLSGAVLTLFCAALWAVTVCCASGFSGTSVDSQGHLHIRSLYLAQGAAVIRTTTVTLLFNSFAAPTKIEYFLLARQEAPLLWKPVVNKGTGIDQFSITQHIEIQLPLWLPFLIFSTPSAFLFWRDRRRIPTGHCQSCGYSLTGNVSGVCPECGMAVGIQNKASAR